jgi:RNA polymerase-associated protein LEO1
MKPFEAETLQLEVEEGMNESEQLESIRQQVESTIRWRARIDENGDEVKGTCVSGVTVN